MFPPLPGRVAGLPRLGHSSGTQGRVLLRSIVQATCLDSPGRSVISGSRINHCAFPAEASTAPGSETWMRVPDPTSTGSA